MSLFEHFYKVLILYLVARIRIRIRIKVTSRIWIRIHIKVTSRMRIRIKVMRIRKCVTNCGGEFHETWDKSELTGLTQATCPTWRTSPSWTSSPLPTIQPSNSRMRFSKSFITAPVRLQNRQSTKLSLTRPNWDSPTPSHAGECVPLPTRFRGKHTRLRERNINYTLT